MEMYRYDIINRLIASRFPTECNYLEIGVRNPADCFDKVLATNKTSVDPGLEFGPNPVDYKMTSDQFFAALNAGETKLDKNFKWDVVFIDGLHLAPQIMVDVYNSIHHTADNGIIVLHDCNPPNWYNAHSDINHFYNNAGYWNGTAWKALYKLRTMLNVDIYTVDMDWGVGVIDKATPAEPIEWQNPFFEYGVMMHDRKNHLGLISYHDFTQKVKV